jgi:GT2 family glycosyltransferase
MDDSFTIAVCICTRNRPSELHRALTSVGLSTYPVRQIVVADDSDDDRSRKLIRSSFPSVDYISGPRLGLTANRNTAIKIAKGTHILFLDDDATLEAGFVEKIYRRLVPLSMVAREHTIVTGTERNGASKISPNEQGFLGFQNRHYRKDEPLTTVVINATLFPRKLFDTLRFDPCLRYGYDEVDLTTQAVALGYTILACFDATNGHDPSPINRNEYKPYIDASRLYVTLKRRGSTEGKPIRAWVGFIVSVCHVYAATIKRDGRDGPRAASATLKLAWRNYRSFRLSHVR